MRVSHSEAYDRVVNRTLYSKKIVLAVAIATLMFASAFVVSVGSHATLGVGLQLQGWTLKPPANLGWTTGNIKGYCEGDVVPVNLTVWPNENSHVSITIGFEWGYGTIADPDFRGFDRVVEYTWSGEPEPPFNDPEDPPPGPFYEGPGATIVSQTHLVPYEDGPPQWKIWDRWQLEVDLGDVEETWLRVGGLLYVTNTDPGQLGASYFPGSSLHVRMLDVNGKKSAEDISINVEQVMTPPEVTLEKFCTPDTVLVGQTITFTIAWENTGMANATDLELWEIIPVSDTGYPLLAYVAGSGVMWNSTNPALVPVSDPVADEVEDPVLAWIWDCGWIAEGTGPGGLDPVIVYYLRFQVTVIRWDLGVQPNHAKLWYSDDHNGDRRYAEARCHFTILWPDIMIEKWELYNLECAAGKYILWYDEHGDPVLYAGDWITYVIRVTNPSPDTTMEYEVYDPVLGGSSPIMSGTLDPNGDYDEQQFPYLVKGSESELPETNYMFRNMATVIAWDVGHIGGKITDSAYYDINIVHPDVTITKTADCSVAAIGEEVQYTITVENTGDVTLETFWIWDYMLDLFNPIYWASIWDPEHDDPDDLSPGEILVLDSSDNPALAHVVQPWDVDQEGYITNMAWIEAWDTQDHYLYRTDTVRILCVHPDIEITKTAVDEDGDEITQVGLSGIVRYKIEVDNTGDVGLWWFYWDTMAWPDWTPVPDDGPIWLNFGDYYIDGCWAVEYGEYCGQVPVAVSPQDGVVAISTHDSFFDDDFSYEVRIYTDDTYWRAGEILRYDELTGDGYLAALYDGGLVLFKMFGNLLYTMGSYSGSVSSGAWHTLKVVVETGPGPDSFFDVYLDAVLVISASDSSALPAGKIGLAVWDEGMNPVHVHFDDVLVEDLLGGVLLEDHFASLIPEDPTPPPELPFADPPGVPSWIKCPFYHARLWSGYLEPGDNIPESPGNPTDVKFYTYEVQDDDPDPLVDYAVALGWWTSDGSQGGEIVHPTSFVWDCDDASVRIRGWLEGYVYHDHNLNDVEMGPGDSGLMDWWVHLYDSELNWLDKRQTDEWGYYVFDMLPPGDYWVKEDLFSADWFSTNPKDISDPEGLWEHVSVVAGFGTHQDFGNALYAYIYGYKWNDWDLDGEQDYPYGDLEPYLNGWVIHCDGWEYDDDMSGPYTVHLTAVTGDDGIPGHYEFKVKPGTYDIWEEFPVDDPLTPYVDESAWYQTYPCPPGRHDDVDIIEGAEIGPKNFGNVPLTTIWGRKFYDKIELNGVMDDGDIGLNGWTITLTGEDAQGNPVSLSTTSGRRAVDVVFAIDLSGSMASWLSQVQSAIADIMDDLVAKGVDAQFGVITFVDYPDVYKTVMPGSVPETYWHTYGDPRPGDYAYQLDQTLTSDTGAVETLVNGLHTYFGADLPQDYSRVIYESYSDPEITWRYCAERILVLFGDALAHDSDFDYNNDRTKDNTGGDPGRDEILGNGDDLDFQTVVAGAAAHGVRIMSVLCYDVWGYQYEWEQMALLTGGTYFDLADVGKVSGTIVGLLDGFFSFQHVLPGIYTLGEVEPVGQEAYWFMTTQLGPIEILEPTVPGEKLRYDIGNMRWAKVWGYKFIDEYGETPEGDPIYPNGVFDPGESGFPGWPIHWKPVGGDEPIESPVYTMDNVQGTPEDETGLYWLMLLPGDYEIWEEVLPGWEATTPWDVILTIPAHPWGPPVIKRLDFGNTQPLCDPTIPFALEAGWNLWSCPVTLNGMTAKSLLALMGPTGKIVTKYDEATTKYSSYRVGWPDAYDFPIVNGKGYFISVSARTYFTVMGDSIGPSEITLVSGWNLVGYNLLKPMKASGLLAMVTGCNGKILTYFDENTKSYNSYRKGWPSAYDFTVEPGRGYYLCVDGPGTLVFG